MQAVRLANAIRDDDLDTVRDLVDRNPNLIREHVLIRTDGNWGPPLTYAAKLGRDCIIRFLHQRGATDLEMYVQRGLELPDTPTMALHRGRIDLLALPHAQRVRPRGKRAGAAWLKALSC